MKAGIYCALTALLAETEEELFNTSVPSGCRVQVRDVAGLRKVVAHWAPESPQISPDFPSSEAMALKIMEAADKLPGEIEAFQIAMAAIRARDLQWVEALRAGNEKTAVAQTEYWVRFGRNCIETGHH
jgi:hypothetical protein